MTLEQFLEKLEQTPRDWLLLRGRMIRCRGGFECPISTLSGMFACAYNASARKLGLDDIMAENIATAADAEQDPTGELGKIRAKLLKACGLAEVGG